MNDNDLQMTIEMMKELYKDKEINTILTKLVNVFEKYYVTENMAIFIIVKLLCDITKYGKFDSSTLLLLVYSLIKINREEIK